jgi:hypothetical protein
MPLVSELCRPEVAHTTPIIGIQSSGGERERVRERKREGGRERRRKREGGREGESRGRVWLEGPAAKF